MEYQNIAYCRFVFIWALLFIFNFIKFSPLLTLIFESTSKKPYITTNKKTGLLLSEIIFIVVLLFKSRKLYVFENISFFLIYLVFLYTINVNIFNLHNHHLVRDDLIYSQENYKDYFIRIWSTFISN